MLALAFGATAVHAACSGPAGTAGQMTYASNYNSMAYCDGSNWVSMAGGVSVTIGGTTNNYNATAAGSAGYVQYNDGSNGFAASSSFTYSGGLLTVTGTVTATNVYASNISTTTLWVNGQQITGNASGDRIVSGSLLAVANSATGYISLTTNGTNWGYLSSGNNYLPNLRTSTLSATVISATAIQLVSQSASPVTCNSGNSGTLRYNSPTTTLELCTGTGWQPMGVGIPAGTIAAFASTTCPTGWSEYTAARGRFLRGIDNGAGVDPSGTRTPGSTQDDLFRSHTHTQQTANNGTTTSGVEPKGVNDSTGLGSSGRSTLATGGAETRPANVAVTFCQFNGTSNGWNNPLSGSGGGNPGGNNTYVQYNSSGSFAGDSNFTYSSGLLTVTGTTSATNVYASSVSGTTGTFGSIGVGNLAASGYVRAATISASTAIQVGSNNLTCASGISGTMRYNSVSSTMEYCNGSAWNSLGPSTSVPAFRAYKTSDQTITASTWTKLTWQATNFDTTNGGLDLVNSKFQPTTQGKYLIIVSSYCNNSPSTCYAGIAKNGSLYAAGGPYNAGASLATVSTIIDLNGSTDYIEGYTYSGSTNIWGQNAIYTYMAGTLLAAGSGGSGGGSTSPGGNTTNIQYNSSGNFAGSDNFAWANGTNTVSVTGTVTATNVYASNISTTTLWVNGQQITGSASGDRIVSGSLLAVVNSATGYISLTTSGTNWGYLSSGASYLPNLTAGLISATNISGTLIQVGSGNGANCDNGHKGSLRYNSTSSTMEYCNSSAWTTLGPSTSVPAFSVYKTATQTVTTNTFVKLTWDAEDFDTNNNFASNRFTPTVPGKYQFNASILCADSSSQCVIALFKNGTNMIQSGDVAYNGGAATAGTANVSGILELNGSTDYVEVYVYNGGGTSVRGTFRSDSNFSGALLGAGGGSGGGATSPGGNSTNIQYNSSGNFAGSDNFAWANGTNTVSVTGTVSATYGYFKYISATNGGLGVSYLSSLTDVSVSASPMNGGILTYASGKWQAVSPSQILSTTTMVPNWPDAIKCYGSNGSLWVYLTYLPTSSGNVNYDAPFAISGQTFQITFSSSGTVSSVSGGANWTGFYETNCAVGGTVSDAYSAGNAFNFIGNNGASGSTALGDRITSGTTAVTTNSATNTISLTVNNVTTGYINSSGLLVVPGISLTQNYGVSSTTGYFSGNVGIGTSNPNAKLEVNGTISATRVTGLSAPQVTVYTSGSGTYYTPANALYLIVEMVSGGGGGGGVGTSGGGNGGTGGTSFFGTVSCGGGGGGSGAGGASGGGGGSCSNGDVNISGGQGGGANGGSPSNLPGGNGGNSYFGGGHGIIASGGNGGGNGQANTGGGGSGASSITGYAGGTGGGAGGYARKLIGNPAASYSYAVGGGGSAGSAGGSGAPGGAGGSGIIIVTAYFQ